MRPPEVHTANQQQREVVTQIMLLGFSADPIARWIWPDAGTFLQHKPHFVSAFGGRGFEHRSVFITSCNRAAAMWLPPTIEPDGEHLDAIMGASIDPERMEEIGGFFEQIGEFHPDYPCWYLPMIGADPAHTGLGLGAALMKHALTMIDAQQLPSYLESSNPRNISLYERHGFEVMGQIQSGSSPIMTPMLRAARR